jgi:serralysin
VGVTGQSYTALQYDYDSSGHLATSLTTNTNGTYTLVGHENGLTLTATTGPETLRGGGVDETFVFSTPFGHDTLSDFASTLSGASPDLLSLPRAAFNDSFSQLLTDTAFTKAGATITVDPSDTIYAPGLSKSLMLASQQDFVFHS